MVKKLIMGLLVVVAFLSYSVSVGYAQDNNVVKITTEKTLPSDGYKYSLKRLKEKSLLSLFSVSRSRKADYYQKLLEARLSELYVVASKKDIANIEKSSLRYAASAGELTEFVVAHKLNTRKDILRDIFKRHISVLEAAKLNYDPETSEWRFLHDDINYLNSYILTLSEDNK